MADDATVLKSDMVKKILQDLIARYKKAFASWKASGKGKMGQGKEGETICLLIKGTDYKDTSLENTTSQSSIVTTTDTNSAVTILQQQICGVC